jgi:hypothetical protein
MQGESDSSASSSYARHLEILIAELRKDIGAPSLPAVIGRVAPNESEGRECVRRAQMEVAEADPLAVWVDTDDLVRFDGTHFDAQSTLTLGHRMAEAWQQMVQGATGLSH